MVAAQEEDQRAVLAGIARGHGKRHHIKDKPQIIQDLDEENLIAGDSQGYSVRSSHEGRDAKRSKQAVMVLAAPHDWELKATSLANIIKEDGEYSVFIQRVYEEKQTFIEKALAGWKMHLLREFKRTFRVEVCAIPEFAVPNTSDFVPIQLNEVEKKTKTMRESYMKWEDDLNNILRKLNAERKAGAAATADRWLCVEHGSENDWPYYIGPYDDWFRRCDSDLQALTHINNYQYWPKRGESETVTHWLRRALKAVRKVWDVKEYSPRYNLRSYEKRRGSA